MTTYDEMTARVMAQSILLDVLAMKIRKTQKDRVLFLLRGILPDPMRYLEMQKGRFNFEHPNILGSVQEETI